MSPVDTLEEELKKLLTPVLAAAASVAAVASPALADEAAFNEEAVAAMKGNIVIEAPWAVSMKEDEIIVFMTIHNGGDESDTITGISSDLAETAAIARFEGGAMLNAEGVESLEAPQGEATSLDQDGYHLVLTDLTDEIESGDTVPVTLRFEEMGELDVDVSVTVIQ